MTEKLCIRCVVSGRVQGVWFRASACEQAQQRGLCGWVRNLPDGQVEVLACGSAAKVAEFHQWLHQGPRLAKVIRVSYEEVPWEEHIDFKIV